MIGLDQRRECKVNTNTMDQTVSKAETILEGILGGELGSLVRSHLNGLIPFKRTKEQTTRKAHSLKKITAANNGENYELTTADPWNGANFSL